MPEKEEERHESVSICVDHLCGGLSLWHEAGLASANAAVFRMNKETQDLLLILSPPLSLCLSDKQNSNLHLSGNFSGKILTLDFAYTNYNYTMRHMCFTSKILSLGRGL